MSLSLSRITVARSIKQEATRSNGGLCAEEASYLETKMQIIKCFLFNSPEAHQSMYVPSLPPLYAPRFVVLV
jgi:hypothetical protein